MSACLQKRGEASDPQSGADDVQEGEISHQVMGIDSEHQLQPLNIRMLQGAFYMLIIGYLISGELHSILCHQVQVKLALCFQLWSSRLRST